MKLKNLSHDLFFIGERLKRINKNYYVVFNRKLRKFEVHFKGQKYGSFCFCVEDNLDASVIKKTYLTQVKNAKKLFKEIEDTNKKIEEEKQRKLIDKHMSDFELMINYAQRRAGEVDFFKFNK